MSTAELIELLRTEAAVISRNVPSTMWFLFGSALVDTSSATDIDLLVLCRSDADVARIRHRLARLCLSLPLHLFLVTRDEEHELKFIEMQRCRRIYPTSEGPTTPP
jgi:hypothetical protein